MGGGKQCACRPLELFHLGSTSADVREVGRWPRWWKLRLRPCPSATPCAPSWTASTSRQAWLPCPMPELHLQTCPPPPLSPPLSLSRCFSLSLSHILWCPPLPISCKGVLLCPFHVKVVSEALSVGPCSPIDWAYAAGRCAILLASTFAATRLPSRHLKVLVCAFWAAQPAL